MDKITHEVRLAQWAEVVRQCQARPAGMSANTWLKENGIAVKNYYYWQRRVRNEVYNQVTSLAPAGNTHNEISFAEVPGEMLDTTNEPTDTHQGFLFPDAIIKTGHLEIQIHNSLSPMLLKSIMEVAFRDIGVRPLYENRNEFWTMISTHYDIGVRPLYGECNIFG